MSEKVKQDSFEPVDVSSIEGDENRVVKLEEASPEGVKEYHFSKISKIGDGDYNFTRKNYGPLAATDPDRIARTKHDSRFKLNSMLRGPLNVEEEEKRVIEEKVRVRIEAVAEEAREKASKKGYEEGFKKGYDEAYQKYKEEGKDRLAQLEKFFESSEKAKEEIFRENERFLIDLVYQIGKMILLKDLSVDEEYVLRLSKELIERVGVRENITVKINPNDSKSMTLLKSGLEESFKNLKNLNIETSDQVKGGGCIVETKWNAIDASIEKELKNLYASLLGRKKEDELENQ